MSSGIGSEGQFDPIRLGVGVIVGVGFVSFGVVVSPSMAEKRLSARRVNETNLHLFQVWRGGSTSLN